MATFSLMRKGADGQMIQIGESIEADLPLHAPLIFGPVEKPGRAVIQIKGADGIEIECMDTGKDLVEGDELHVKWIPARVWPTTTDAQGKM